MPTTPVASSAAATIGDHRECFIITSFRPTRFCLDDLRARRTTAVGFLHGLVAGQIIGVVGVVAVGRTTRQVVQQRAHEMTRQTKLPLDYSSLDNAVAVPGSQRL